MRKSLFVLAALLLTPCAHARKPKTKDLVAAFKAAKAPERIRLAAALGRMKNDDATAALIHALDVRHGSPRESIAYVEALGLAGDPRAETALATAWDYLRSLILQMGELPGQLQVLRWKILDALSRLGDERATRILFEALNDQDQRVVEEAVRGLGRLRVKDAVPALQQLADGATGNLLQAIIEALGDIGDKRALSTLERLFTNMNKYIEVETAYALTQLGRRDMVLRLQHFLDGDPGEDKVGLLAAYYLVKLDKSSGLDYLERALARPGSLLAPVAADILGKTENPRAILALREALKSPDTAVRLSAARALGRLGGPRAAAALKRLRDDPNAGVRGAAANGLLGLGEVESP